MDRKAVLAITLTLMLLSMLTLAFAQVPSATPYTDFHDLLYAGSSNLQTIIGFAYESFSQPGLWLGLGELNPDFVDPWYDNNNFVPASGRLLISVHDIKPLSEQILTVEFDTGSLSKIYVPSTDGTTYWLYLWVADDGSTYYDKEMSLPARVAPSPVEATQELIETIETWNLSKGAENCLTSKLNNVIHLLGKRNEKGATHKLIVVVNQVEALRGKKLTIEQAEYLISEAQRIIDLIEGLTS